MKCLHTSITLDCNLFNYAGELMKESSRKMLKNDVPDGGFCIPNFCSDNNESSTKFQVFCWCCVAGDFSGCVKSKKECNRRC